MIEEEEKERIIVVKRRCSFQDNFNLRVLEQINNRNPVTIKNSPIIIRDISKSSNIKTYKEVYPTPIKLYMPIHWREDFFRTDNMLKSPMTPKIDPIVIFR